ncbi:MAG: cytochrome C [Desulfuromonadales bacterium]|nr:cytochrome C [Desulfuromonadales bacterium]
MIRILQLFTVGLLLGASTLWAADFKHDAHLAMAGDPPCITCHTADAQGIQPDKKVCLECHDQAFVNTVKLPGLLTHDVTWALNHRGPTVSKSIDCAACHEQDYCLDCHKAGRADEMGNLGNTMTNVHRSEFSVSHPIAARTNQQLCNKCHESKFCVECHDDFNRADLALDSHRKGFINGSFGGAHAGYSEQECQDCHRTPQGLTVLPSHQWSNSHAREARKSLATCQACHPDGDVCLKCHSDKSGLRVNPHPRDWDEIKNRLKRASDAKTCRKCH